MKKDEWVKKINKLIQEKKKIQAKHKIELKEINKNIKMYRSCIFIYEKRGK